MNNALHSKTLRVGVRGGEFVPCSSGRMNLSSKANQYKLQRSDYVYPYIFKQRGVYAT